MVAGDKSQEASLAPGFFGKLPSRGDFLARRVPPVIASAWEDWLATLVIQARAGLRDDWPDAWLTAPLWHFVLGTKLLPPHGGAGIVVASVDRVGRMFPFSIIGAADAPEGDGASRRWACRAETLLLDALDDSFDPSQLDDALLRLGPPPACIGGDRQTGAWPLLLDGDWPAAPDTASTERTQAAPGAGQTVWWCRGSDRMEPVWLCCDGLPEPDTAQAMITGAFRGMRTSDASD
jgi:type VI secretion system protein ImpM